MNLSNKSIKTNHGIIKTPFFMPDATRGFIKTLGNSDLEILKMGPMVVNTFHLYLQPGLKIIKKAGGIHKFMNWDGPLLSDSGGYQVFSLIHQNSKMGKITDEGAFFTSPINGSKHILTPEKSIQIQFDLGVDMMVVLDDCPPNDYEREKIEEAVERTIKWAKRCKAEYEKKIKSLKSPKPPLSRGLYQKPLLFAVIQGGKYLDLRKKCADELIKIGFDGYGFGARHIDGEGKFMDEILKKTAEMIPDKAIKFALGVGTPKDIIKCASYGWDMFDCVIPTREGRHGRLFFWNNSVIARSLPRATKALPAGRQESRQDALSEIASLHRGGSARNDKNSFYNTINISNAKFAKDFSPINKDSNIKELREYSKAYLHFLFKNKETLGHRLASLNNLEFYLALMKLLKVK